MRTRSTTWLAVAALVTLVAACGDDGSGVGSKSASGTSAPSSSADPATSEATATTGAAAATTAGSTVPETSAPESTVPETTVAGPSASEAALAGFVKQVESAVANADAAWQGVDDARKQGATDIPKELWDVANLAGSDFYGLADLIPAGVFPEVRQAAIRVLYDVGNYVAPFAYAPGFDLTSWDPAWDEAHARAMKMLPDDQQALRDLTLKFPDVRDVAPDGQEAAAASALSIVVVRSFGHSLTPDPFPYSLAWLGELPPPDPNFSTPYCANVPYSGGTFTGSFVDGVGGCAILYYGDSDPAAHEEELKAYLDEPANVVGPPGEIITITWDAAAHRFVAEGSAE